VKGWTVVKYIGIVLFFIAYGVLSRILYVKYFCPARTTQKPIEKNEASLRPYLSSGTTKPEQSVSVVRQNSWKETTNCVAEGRGKERLFCVEDAVINGVLTVTVYPNQTQIAATDPEKVDWYLNYLIMSVLEKRFTMWIPRRKISSWITGNPHLYTWYPY
jgi:hypothetical protein